MTLKTPHQPLDMQNTHCKYFHAVWQRFCAEIFCLGTLVILADSVALVRAYEARADVLVLAEVCELTDEGDLHMS